MRCVSYTRTTSCFKMKGAQRISIAEQNAHISDYAKAHGFRLQKKYSDRKDDPEEVCAFEKMRIDGQNRSFDLLIFDSFWQCGKDVYAIVRVLLDSFYPAGIQFAVVQENYCSVGRSYDEVTEYLEKLNSMYRGHLTSSHMEDNPHMLYVDTYGYRYNKEKDILEIDEETASNVREIFSKLVQGKTPLEIARELKERGAETPGDYMRRIKGWKTRGKNSGWTGGTVYSIARNPKFAGQWEKIDNGKNYADDCDPIIEPEVFDAVQKQLCQRNRPNVYEYEFENPFKRMMTDEETGATVIMRKNKYTGLWNLRFKPRKPEGVRYEKFYMDYQEGIDQIRALLTNEHDMAVAAAEHMDSNIDSSYKERMVDEQRRLVPDIMKKIFRSGRETMRLYSMHELGEISDSEYMGNSDVAEKEMAAAEAELLKISDTIRAVETGLSKENPWINLFLQYDENHELTHKYLKKFCEHVNIWRFEEIRPVFREAEWKAMIPASWMEVCDGTSKQTKYK